MNGLSIKYHSHLEFSVKWKDFLEHPSWFWYRLSVVDKGDWKNVLDMVTNAKQMVSSMQDVARKLSDYAKLRCKNDSSGRPTLPSIML